MIEQKSTLAHIRKAAIDECCHVPASDDEPILFREPLGRACFAMALEDEFGIESINEDEAERCCTLGDWVNLVERHIGAKL